MNIISLNTSPTLWDEVVNIFFESSSVKEFTDEKSKEEFLYKYLGYYKENYPEFFLVATFENKVLGYICGSPNSLDDSELLGLLPHFGVFKDLYDDFPAHLHINLARASRGMGVGSKLVQRFESICRGGVHLITSPTARNKSFYLKNGYNFNDIRVFSGSDLLFMGKSIIDR